MTLLVGCQSISKSFGAQRLFSKISISFFKDERLGLIGPNGAGKSTFLKILAGQIQVDEGELAVKKGVKLCYLPQDDRMESAKSVEQILSGALAQENLEDTERYNRIQKWISRSGIPNPEQKADTLSGGWRKRLAITALLIKEPALALLDEPTNHLDLEGILWLEELLQDPAIAFIIVSHDRYFLENVTTRTVELNRIFPDGFLKVDGPYSDFIYYREAFLHHQAKLEMVLSNKVRRENAWLQRGPKARTSKARFRIDEAYRLRDELSEVRSRNVPSKAVGIDFEASGRRTKKLFYAENIAKTLGGRKLFQNVNLTLTPGKCVGILGVNGSGKSTLINILAGQLPVDEGKIKPAEDVKIVLFDQKREQLNPEQTLHQALAPSGDSVVYRGRSIHVISWAKRFLFRTDQLELPVSMLSGGEKARILIARLMLQPADILLLDEPTNDLDIPALEVLEDNLARFPGAIVLVTHDRFLLDRLAGSILALNSANGAEWYADYNQWLSSKKAAQSAVKTDREKTKPRKTKSRRLSYQEQRELAEIEGKITKAEEELQECQQRIADPEVANNPGLLQDYCLQLQSWQEEIDQHYSRWEELEKNHDE